VSPFEKRLGAAHLRVAEAERVLAAATNAATKAQEFAATTEAEVAKHVERDQALAADRAEGLKHALKSGFPPKFVASPTTKERVQRVEAEDRQTAARKAAEDLSADADSAKATLDDAQAELAAAARAVLSEEAEAYAAKVVELELEAVSNRNQLEASLRSTAAGWGSNSAAKSMIESERVRASARRAADDLPAEAPAQDPVLDAARVCAAKVVALELEALSNRVRLEASVRSGTLGWGKQIALSQLAQRVVQENLSTSIAVKNSSEWAASNQAANVWRQRHAKLLNRSNAAPVEGDVA
jgi:hypothetical protein